MHDHDHVLIAIIGAGLSGICAAVQLKRLLNCTNKDFVIYEKGSEVGGTWAQNRYPNLGCDVPSEFYSYSFFPNPDWTEKYASQPEILAYIKQCVKHFDIASTLRLEQECLSIVWDPAAALWSLEFRDGTTGETSSQRARYVITAMGVFNNPKGLQDIPVLQAFRGPVVHTSQWRQIDFEGKNVLVIGNGCSANQVVPWVLSEGGAKSLTQIVRSEQWVAPKGNFKHSLWFRKVLRYVPLAMKSYRLWTAWQLDAAFLTYRKSPAGDAARAETAKAIRQYMESVSAPAYHDKLIPPYAFGSKRPVMDHGYLSATNLENFCLVKCDGVGSVESDGRAIVDALGNRHEVDIVILANGFQTQDLLAPMRIQGLSSRELRQDWKTRGGAEAYMGVSTAGYPNLFFLAGPNTLPSSNSTLHGIECSVVYITRVLQRLKQRGQLNSAVLDVSPDAEKGFNEMVQRNISKLIYAKTVSTWYINKDTGKNTLVWPGTQLSFWYSRCVKAINWSAWKIKST